MKLSEVKIYLYCNKKRKVLNIFENDQLFVSKKPRFAEKVLMNTSRHMLRCTSTMCGF